MAIKMWYDLTPVGNYVSRRTPKAGLVEALKKADNGSLSKMRISLSEMLKESEQLLGNAYISNIATKNKATIGAIAPPIIAGILGLAGKALGILADYESIAYLTGLVGSISLPISYMAYLDSESAEFSEELKKRLV